MSWQPQNDRYLFDPTTVKKEPRDYRAEALTYRASGAIDTAIDGVDHSISVPRNVQFFSDVAHSTAFSDAFLSTVQMGRGFSVPTAGGDASLVVGVLLGVAYVARYFLGNQKLDTSHLLGKLSTHREDESYTFHRTENPNDLNMLMNGLVPAYFGRLRQDGKKRVILAGSGSDRIAFFLNEENALEMIGGDKRLEALGISLHVSIRQRHLLGSEAQGIPIDDHGLLKEALDLRRQVILFKQMQANFKNTEGPYKGIIARLFGDKYTVSLEPKQGLVLKRKTSTAEPTAVSLTSDDALSPASGDQPTDALLNKGSSDKEPSWLQKTAAFFIPDEYQSQWVGEETSLETVDTSGENMVVFVGRDPNKPKKAHFFKKGQPLQRKNKDGSSSNVVVTLNVTAEEIRKNTLGGFSTVAIEKAREYAGLTWAERIKKFINGSHETRLGKVIWPIWLAMNTYIMVYWIIWMSAVLKGVTVATGIMFGVPLIIPLALLALVGFANLYHYAVRTAEERAKIEKEVEASRELEEETRRLIPAIFAHEYTQQLLKKLKDLKNAPTTDDAEHVGQSGLVSEVAAATGATHSEAPALEFESRLIRWRWGRIALTAVAGLVIGYIGGLYLEWPLTDFLVQILHLTTAAALVTPLGIGIATACALAVGLFYFTRGSAAISAEFTANEKKLAENADKLKEMRSLNEEVEALRKRNAALYAEIKANYEGTGDDKHLALLANLLVVYPRYDDDRFFRSLEPKPSLGARIKIAFKKLLTRGVVLLNRLETGALLIRLVLGVGGFATLFILAPVPPVTFIVLAVVAGLVLAAAKLAEYNLLHQQARDLRLLNELPQRKQHLEDEKSVMLEWGKTLEHFKPLAEAEAKKTLGAGVGPVPSLYHQLRDQEPSSPSSSPSSSPRLSPAPSIRSTSTDGSKSS